MLGQHFATILARTDPFDLAQALERYIRSLSGEQIRALIQDAAPRMNDGYRAEFLPLADESGQDRLRAAFAHSLKSNLRAIPLFGPEFCQGVIANIPGDRTVGLGEEGNPAMRLRPLAFAIIALALLIGGAAAEHVMSTARANANTPVVLVTPQPAQPVATPAPAIAAPATRPPPKRSTPQRSARQRSTPQPVPPAPAAVARVDTPVPAPVVERPALPPPVRRPSARRAPPPGSGVKTIVAREPEPTPTPQPTPVDVTDMPQSYSDATPLPADATPPPAQLNTSVRVPTPTPAPNRYWLHQTVNGVGKTIDRLNPFKHHRHPSPSASPYGPEQP